MQLSIDVKTHTPVRRMCSAFYFAEFIFLFVFSTLGKIAGLFPSLIVSGTWWGHPALSAVMSAWGVSFCLGRLPAVHIPAMPFWKTHLKSEY